MAAIRLYCRRCGVLSLLLAFAAAVFGQGSLTPPVGPAPTMKTLAEVEPRTNLQSNPAPAGVDTTNADYHFIINQPGSYYLSAKLVVTKPHGIRINAPGVTLDLLGFEISRGAGSGGDAISVKSDAYRAAVQNGSITGFATGISAGTTHTCVYRNLRIGHCSSGGITAGEKALVESCRVHDSGSGIYASFGSLLVNCSSTNTSGTGIFVADGTTLKNCSVKASGGIYGFYAGEGSILESCVATNNRGSYAMYAAAGSTLTNCSASDNTATYGIFVGDRGVLTNCTASENRSSSTTSAGIGTNANARVSGCASTGNWSTVSLTIETIGMGFDIGPGSTVENCKASFNQGDGIRIRDETRAERNHSNNNGRGAGIHALGRGNHIEANVVIANSRGIDVDGINNLIVKNSASGNATNYDLAANNRHGPIVDLTSTASPAVIGNSALDTTSTDHPWANFAR